VNKYEIAPAYSPSWRKLYSMVRKFVQTEPWELFENEDVFIVQSPRDSQMYLCCVMGNGGEEFGLNAFRGAQGMRNFEKMVTRGGDGPPDRSLMYELDMLSFSLSPRDFMEKNDLNVTKKLMLSFTGGEWPLFRSYKPHYFPWFLTENEIESLYDCLEQTLALYDQGEDSLDDIRDAAPGEMLVRCKEDDEWVSRKVHIAYPAKEETPEIRLHDVTMQRLLNLPDTGLKEEIDLVHLPGPIKDHEPPYHGLILLGVNEKQSANQYGLFAPFTDYFQESCDNLLQSFLSRGSKPRTVVLKDDSAFADLFESIARQVDIRFERSDELPYIADFLDSMEQAMSDGSFPMP
jgi:hypothetical protein